MKKFIFTRKEVLTVPNLLTLIRLLSVPVYMVLIILGGLGYAYPGLGVFYPKWYVYVGLGVMVFAASTDVIDGFIARKYNQGSYLGQLVDPIADKAMHIGCLIALIVVKYIHWAFVIFLVLREFMMILVGTFLYSKINIKANMLGKVASATLSVGMITCFFHPYIAKLWGEFGIDWIIVAVGLALNLTAAVIYAADAVRQCKAIEAGEAKTTEEIYTEKEKAEAETKSAGVGEKDERKTDE